jgi:hypothetical protein
LATRLTRATAGVAGRLGLVIVVAFALAACAPARRGPTYPPAGATPAAATTQIASARSAVAAALAASGLAVVDATQAYQPAEGAWFAAAPRAVLELDAPAQGAIGFVVLYAFASPADAQAAAQDQAAYVSSGAGRVYFAGGTHFTIRVLDSAVVFFAWAPGAGDPRLAGVEAALGGLGVGVTAPG